MFQTGNRYSTVGEQQFTQNPSINKDHITLQLQQLYKNGSKETEESNSITGTTKTNNITST
jgi:hypothetical protein